MATNIQISQDLTNKSIHITVPFNSPLMTVWKAFTDNQSLEQWWAPLPWKAETKSMKFKVGGYWLYAMVRPEGQKHWGRMNYTEINPMNYFCFDDAFCDENGNYNKELPASRGRISFIEETNRVIVKFDTIFPSEEDLEKTIEMGFEQGISMTLEHLDELLSENKI